MKSSSLKGQWATFRLYLFTAGLLGTLALTLSANDRPAWVLWALGGAGVYAVISAVTLLSVRNPQLMNVIAVVDVLVMATVIYFAGSQNSAALISLYGLISLTSLATNLTVGLISAAVASVAYAAAVFVIPDQGDPMRTATGVIAPIVLFFIFGTAGASMRRQLFGGATHDAVNSRDRQIDEAQKKARNLSLEKEERERQLYDKQRKLYTLMSISHLMSSTRNTKAVLQVMCTKAREEMNCGAAFVMMVEQGELRLVQSIGISELTKRLMDTKVGEGILGEVVATNKIVNLSEKDADPRLNAFRKNWESFRNILVVPLATSQDLAPFGVLGAANLLVGESFQEEHEDYLKIMATSASISLKNITLTEELEQSFHEIIHALAQAIEAKDPYTHGHIGRVQEYAVSLAQALKRPEAEVKIIAKGAILHDVGKISTPNEILNKPGALTPAERKKMDDHVTSSIHILKDIKSLPAEVFEMVLYHHERYDGKGYPYGLKGDEIPIGAQIISVVDAYDAMTTDRPYRKGFPQEKALELLANSSGSQFNPKVLQAFFTLFNYKPRNANPQLELTK